MVHVGRARVARRLAVAAAQAHVGRHDVVVALAGQQPVEPGQQVAVSGADARRRIRTAVGGVRQGGEHLDGHDVGAPGHPGPDSTAAGAGGVPAATGGDAGHVGAVQALAGHAGAGHGVARAPGQVRRGPRGRPGAGGEGGDPARATRCRARVTGDPVGGEAGPVHHATAEERMVGLHPGVEDAHRFAGAVEAGSETPGVGRAHQRLLGYQVGPVPVRHPHRRHLGRRLERGQALGVHAGGHQAQMAQGANAGGGPAGQRPDQVRAGLGASGSGQRHDDRERGHRGPPG